MKIFHIYVPGILKCHLCPHRLAFDTKKKFEEHQKLHSSLTACECIKCNVALACYNDLLAHIHKHHKPTPILLDVKCLTCEKTFTTFSGLRHHVFIEHFARRFVCQICGHSCTTNQGKFCCVNLFFETNS
jgi:hypothetical protein